MCARSAYRATEIQVGDRSTLIVPNSELITKSVRNMTLSNPMGRVQLQFSVPLETDVAKVRDMLLALFAEHEKVLAEPAPSVFIDSLAGGHVNFNSFAYVSSPRDSYGVRSQFVLCTAAAHGDGGHCVAVATGDPLQPRRCSGVARCGRWYVCIGGLSWRLVRGRAAVEAACRTGAAIFDCSDRCIPMLRAKTCVVEGAMPSPLA